MPAASDVKNGTAPPAGSAAMPHIDDITATPTDIDVNQSIKRLLELCEANLGSAEMSREFKRPAIALKYYVKASIIAVHIISNHRDYPSLQSSHGGELQRKYNDVLRRIKTLYEPYNQVKAEITKDNERSGVRPSKPRPGSSQAAGHPQPNGNPHSSLPNGSHNKAAQAPANSSHERTKPPVPHPKPQSLHGNALKNGHARSNSAVTAGSDLAARFAGLRGPQASPGQDPRIRTHAFGSPPKPAGPRQMPPGHQKPHIGLDSSVSALPKPPDAIYSPARGNMSEESARMPSSTPRGFSRTGSSASGTSSPSASTQPPSRDYFTPVYTNSFSADPASLNMSSLDQSSSVTSPRRSLDLGSKEVIEAEELYHAMKERGSVLIIDIRPRDEFDEGHIMSSSTICIEQSILARENLSADDIGDSLVISPNQTQEQSLFEKRGDYDLVVFYDQESEFIPRPPRSPEEQALASLHRALVHLNYGKELKQSPRLLKGGLEAWVELMGPASLQSTSSSSLKTSQLRRGPTGRRKSRYRIAPLKADEVKAWQETLNKEDLASASSPTLYRTTEDFVRRFPAVPLEPENMTSASPPIRPEKRVDYQISHDQRVVGDLPAPLTRPAPAVSRPSHSGLSIETDGKGAYGEQKAVTQQASGRSSKTMEQASADIGSFYTGLHNPQNWCYANSVLQSLLACEFGKELTNSDWKRKYVVPKKANEKIEQPQLLMQILSNLFHWMSSGKFEVMKAGTLMSYSRHVSVQTRAIEKFGDSSQHDAQEFITFLFTHLDDETNSQRHMQGHPAPPNTSNQSILEAAIEYWGNHLQYHQSTIDRYWRLIELGITRCHACGNNSYNFNTVTMINPSIGNADTTLERALTDHIADDVLSDYMCDRCKRPVQATLRFAYPRMPPLLCISFGRFGYNEGGSVKSNARITWDLNDLDMAPYFLRPDACHLSRDTDDKAFKGRFGYECFAVIEHMGSSPDSGHYTAYVRDPRTHDPYAWLYCNDSRVDKVRMDNPNERMRVFKDGDRVPYLAFFRRKGGS